MDVRQLQYFLAVVDEGGVHAAAEKLFVAQPSVSQSLRALQRTLGAELFTRTGRRLQLTAAGEALVAPARQVLHWMELSRAHVEAVNGLRTGRLVVATMPSQAVDPLPTVIDRFVRKYPMVQISIRSAGTPQTVMALVRSGGVELGVMAVTETPDAEDLIVHPLAQQGFIVISSREANLPARGPLTYDQLEGQRLIIGQPGTGMRRVADQVIAANRSTVAVVETEHREAILPMVLAGTGIAIIAEPWRALAREAGLVVHDLVTDERLEASVVHRDVDLSPAARAFLLLTAPVAATHHPPG
ncbi:LysR family transcriptional regulator [Georgenia sp. M64]|uniref:LysR family transcriptional regulator n=1 Tax=Georgenia sp. M64 TaxID=3120520 RepID=UPI0030E3B1ED